MDSRLWKRYWRRALFAAAVLRCVPFVRMVGLNGSMVIGGIKPGSDIDFFIVLKRGRIFTGRVLVTGVIHLLGLRRYGQHVPGRICLNRYSSRTFLDITPHNRYHARVFHNLVPLFSTGGCYEQYAQENKWMADFNYPIHHWKPILADTMFTHLFQVLGELIFRIPGKNLENWLYQQHLVRAGRDERAHKEGSVVIISEKELRFHLVK